MRPDQVVWATTILKVWCDGSRAEQRGYHPYQIDGCYRCRVEACGGIGENGVFRGSSLLEAIYNAAYFLWHRDTSLGSAPPKENNAT